MKQRCYNPNHDHYKNYGGRGITICDEWLNDFDTFADWAIANGFDKDAPYGECTIDRVNVNGNYEPSNCRFVSLKEQGKNRTNTVRIEYNGETHTPGEWEQITGISRGTIAGRYRDGWSVDDIFNKPVIKRSGKRRAVNMDTKGWFYSPSQVREILGVRQESVYELLESHQIPAFKIGTRWKIPKDLFHEWVKERALEHGEI